MDTTKQLKSLTQYFGTEAIAFALGFDDPHDDDMFDDVSSLDQEQKSVVSELHQKLVEQRVSALRHDAPPQSDSFWVDQEFAKCSEHTFVQTRRKLNANLIKSSDTDEFTLRLINLAADVYPCFLIGRHRATCDRFGFRSPVCLHAGIHASPSTQIILGEVSGSAVFAESTQADLQTKPCWISSGHGYASIRVTSLLEKFLYNAFLLTLMRGLKGFTNFSNSIVELSLTLSEFLEGNNFTIRAPTFIGLSGVELPVDTKDTSIGTMYNMPSSKSWLLNSDLVGQPCGAYIETASDVKIAFNENTLDKTELREVYRQFGDTSSHVRQIQRIARSSLSLSSTRKPITCAPSWVFHCFVLGTGNSGATPTRIPVNKLTEKEFASWAKWIDLFSKDSEIFQKIEIGLERLGDSIYGSRTNEDYLLNATIALENLFGIEHELVYRLSLAVACTLGDSLDSREVLHKKTRDIYAMRSKIVHGGKLKTQDIRRLRSLLLEAIDIYKRCVDQIVHHHRTALLDNKIATTITLGD